MSETSGTIILLKLLKTVEINYVIFPLSLKYLQNKKRKKTNMEFKNLVVGSQVSMRLWDGSASIWNTYWYLVGRQYGKMPGTYLPRFYYNVVP